MNNEEKKKTGVIIALGLGAAAALLLLGRRPREGPQASLSTRILDSLGNEVPHNSAVELQPGDYTIEATVTNLSRSGGAPVGATLTTHIEYSWAGYLMGDFNTSAAYDAEETKIHRFSLNIPMDWVGYPGTINASVLDPSANLLAAATLPFNVIDATTEEEGVLFGIVHFESLLPEGIAWVRSGKMLFIQNDAVVHEYWVSTATTGIFQLKVMSGTYDICVKFPRALSRRVDNVSITPGLTPTHVDFPELIEGDINDDDVIDINDFGLLADAYGSVPGDANWDDRCDLNRNEAVDPQDQAILQTSFGKAGDCIGFQGL